MSTTKCIYKFTTNVTANGRLFPLSENQGELEGDKRVRDGQHHIPARTAGGGGWALITVRENGLEELGIKIKGDDCGGGLVAWTEREGMVRGGYSHKRKTKRRKTMKRRKSTKRRKTMKRRKSTKRKNNTRRKRR